MQMAVVPKLVFLLSIAMREHKYSKPGFRHFAIRAASLAASMQIPHRRFSQKSANSACCSKSLHVSPAAASRIAPWKSPGSKELSELNEGSGNQHSYSDSSRPSSCNKARRCTWPRSQSLAPVVPAQSLERSQWILVIFHVA